ncbi:C40 family peptidase [Algibacter sp. R77976]|uniref:C40 family peptidase n=1 Tax=Algibacter sp. R77976 TaxID=3093873 RepID=UPI0037C7251B
MHRVFLILILIISFSSCKSSKRAKSKKTSTTKIVTKKSKKENPTNNSTSNYSKADYIIDYAKQFKGVRYKWGGTTKSGMDCSGLIYESYKSNDIILPRISRDMAKKGHKIQLKKVSKGDLLFFKTGNRRNSINHVGLIVDIKNNDIKFIHATTSKGVIISGLNETYWLKAFYEARRIL